MMYLLAAVEKLKNHVHYAYLPVNLIGNGQKFTKKLRHFGFKRFAVILLIASVLHLFHNFTKFCLCLAQQWLESEVLRVP